MGTEKSETDIIKSDVAPALLLAAASVGNVLGSCVNWLLGRYLEHFKDRKWFPASPRALERAQETYRRYGRWTLLLSWVPLIGDPITVMAGVMRERLWVFVVLVFVAKTGRYLAVAAITLNLFSANNP
ncbi:MAG: hypothetical protein DI626_08470 [Micavibrio aeruginosavorus]|uniref:VTT domain-containing protein n=1 Tax=Micavibrio aeruginosavorus TaxID=349221 RepID=A0A2W5BRX1_9BACT|nr:MAG: hypothetical protein DI626_08470 [Micavibrio aeruginosavorus]